MKTIKWFQCYCKKWNSIPCLKTIFGISMLIVVGTIIGSWELISKPVLDLCGALFASFIVASTYPN